MSAKRISFGILACLAILGCSDNGHFSAEDIYNKKANEIILRAVKLSECNCIVEVPSQSMIEINKQERPSYDIESELMKKLGIKNRSTLDSLANLSHDFKLDNEALEKNRIQVVTRENLLAVKMKNDFSIFKKCTKGIICINRPIFSRDFNRAVLDFSFAFMCTRGPIVVLEFKNGKWEDVEK